MDEASYWISKQSLPIVIKANGLAAGKGVIIAHSHKEALTAAMEMLKGSAFGEAGKTIVIEEFLEGEEVSFIVVTDGQTVIPLATSQDHKKRDEGEKGLNTGGMGAFSPAPIVTNDLYHKIMKTIIEPTILGLKEENRPYKGFLSSSAVKPSHSWLGCKAPKLLSSSAVKPSHSWLGCKAPKLNFCSAIFFYKRFLTLVVDQGYHR
jgi:phosphoribosylamine-glycine ligase